MPCSTLSVWLDYVSSCRVDDSRHDSFCKLWATNELCASVVMTSWHVSIVTQLPDGARLVGSLCRTVVLKPMNTRSFLCSSTTSPQDSFVKAKMTTFQRSSRISSTCTSLVLCSKGVCSGATVAHRVRSKIRYLPNVACGISGAECRFCVGSRN